MASRKSKDNKSELGALFRLEFYRNKKKWKLVGEKTKPESTKPREPRKSGCDKDLNKTYNVESEGGSGNDTSSAHNKAFFIENTPDDTPSLETNQHSRPSPSQIQSMSQDPDIWPAETTKDPPNTGPNLPPATECNLQWLLKTASLTWTQSAKNAGPQDPPPSRPVVNTWTHQPRESEGVSDAWKYPPVSQDAQMAEFCHQECHAAALPPPPRNIQMAYQEMSELCTKFVPEGWYQGQMPESRHHESWTCPVPPSSPESHQKIWTNEQWRGMQAWRMAPTDQPDGEYETEISYESQYNSDAVDHRAKPVPSYEVFNAEHVYKTTDHCLRDLLTVYQRQDGQLCSDTEDMSVYDNDFQNDSSLEFIREAHEVAHSSENDLTKTNECVCRSWCAGRVRTCSGGALLALAQRSARLLRAALAELAVRGRLRAEHQRTLDEQPTRDTNLFGSEYVVGGSHLPHSTAGLQPDKARVISINMGRPYRVRGDGHC